MTLMFYELEFTEELKSVLKYYRDNYKHTEYAVCR